MQKELDCVSPLLTYRASRGAGRRIFSTNYRGTSLCWRLAGTAYPPRKPGPLNSSNKGCRLMRLPDNVSEYICDSGSLESGCTSHLPPFVQTFHPPQSLLCLCECSLFPGFPRGKNTNAIRFSLPNNRSATFYGPKTEAICQALGRALAKEQDVVCRPPSYLLGWG